MARTNGYSWSPPMGRGPQPGGEPQENNPLPLSDAQLGIWFAQTIDPSSPAFNLAEYLEIGGPIDATLFETALRQVVNETEALRVRFVSGADGPRQVIGPPPDWSMAFIDVRRRCRSASGCRTVDEGGSGDADRPHARSVLDARACSRPRPTASIWYSRYHHIVMDGFSFALLARRVADVYTALAAGRTVGASHLRLPRRLARETTWATALPSGSSRIVEYWMDYLAGLPEPASLGDRQRLKSPGFIRHTGSLPFSTIDQLTLARAAYRGEPAATRHRGGSNLRAPPDRRGGRRSRCSSDSPHDAAGAMHPGHAGERVAGPTGGASGHARIRAGRRHHAADAPGISTPALQRRESAAGSWTNRRRPESVRPDGQYHAVRLRLAV